MKVKLLVLLGMTALPFVPVAQGQNAVFFNKGKMAVIGDGSQKAVLYVDGDFVVSRDEVDDAVKSEIMVNNSEIILKGDFVQNARYVKGVNANVFTYPTSGYVASQLIFQGADLNPTQQRIRTDEKYNADAKGSNYINFPTIVVNNSAGVLMEPEIAADAKEITFNDQEQGGRLILGSRRLMANEVADGSVGASNYYSILAHLMVNEGAIKYKIPTQVTDAAALDKVGTVQVRLALDPTIDEELLANPSLTATEKEDLAKNRFGRSVVGMGSPFKQMSSDYFMWNHLMIPYQNNIIGSTGDAETSPYVVLPAGKGFVTGIDLKGNNVEAYKIGKAYAAQFETELKAKTAFDQRFKDGYVFDRFSFNSLNNVYPLAAHDKSNDKFTRISNPAATEVKGLKPSFNTIKVATFPYIEQLADEDVSVDLVDGFNYLSNPFMTPLDISGILNPVNQNGVNKEAGWDLTIGAGNGFDIYNRVWLLNPSSKASASYNLASNTAYGANQERIYVSYSYLVASTAGSTYVTSDTKTNQEIFGTTIAPLQMFLVYANNGRKVNKITIPASKRQITSAPSFLRSTSSRPADDFYLEVLDNETNVFDRTALVIRPTDEIENNPNYVNISKMSTVVADDATGNADFRSTTNVGTVKGNLNSILYTKDEENGAALESNFYGITPGVADAIIPLYLSPSKMKQKISLHAGRLQTMENVTKIVLEDKLKNKKFDLSTGAKYVTETSANDQEDRFNLIIGLRSTSDVGEDIDNNTNRSIYSYYRDNNLTVTGFQDEDINSTLSIYNLQGQLLDQMKVNQLVMNIPVSYISGAYIVKVVGKKSYVSKFLVK